MAGLIIFDFDGTLCDSLDCLKQLYNQIALQKNYRRIDDKNLPLARSLSFRELLLELNIPLKDVPMLVHKVRTAFAKEVSELKPFPGIEEALSQLKNDGYRLAIVSSNSKESIQKFLSKHQWNYFEFVHRGSSLFGKARTLKFVLKHQGVDRKTVTYVGDETRDFNAATQVGISCLGVSWGFHSPEKLAAAGCSQIAFSPSDIVTLLNKKSVK